MQIGILSGIYADSSGDFRTSYPRNRVPVPKQTGIAKGYLRPADGIEAFATGPGIDRGGFLWRGTLYRVMGTSLVSVAEDGTVTTLGDVGAGGPVRFDEGFDALAIWSGGGLYYWDGVLTQVTDADLGTVIDGCWIAGYFMSTDGTSLIVTELNDKTAVNPLKYGSSEADPDAVKAVAELRGEAIAFNRYSIEAFQNVGGNLFPFQVVSGAQVSRGIVGTHAYAPLVETFAFVGGGRNEAVSVYAMGAGSTVKLATREIEVILQGYTEDQLAACFVESRVDRGHEFLYVHLTDQTLVYDAAGSAAVQSPVWFTLTSSVVGRGRYRARGFVSCYGKWIAGDPTSASLGAMSVDVSTHYGQVTGWDFGTEVLYNESRGAIIHELELVALPGRVALGADPVVWTSYSVDGETWSAEIPTKAGKQGNREQRIGWRGQGRMKNYRVQRFRGTSDAHISFARLEARIEPLAV